jgi:hypothetical protein
MNSVIPSLVAYINLVLEPMLSYLSLKQHPFYIIALLVHLVKIMSEKHSTISAIDNRTTSQVYDYQINPGTVWSRQLAFCTLRPKARQTM